MLSQRSTTLAVVVAGAAVLFVSEPASRAQTAANGLEVDLVRQDQSDCTNTTVPVNPPTISGTVSLNRGSDGNTAVKVAITVSPDTTYHFFLKCVRQLGDITTGDEGTGFGSFTFRTDEVGATYGFDMYPEGAPLGNKFQSVTVKF
jgi:hypothetical protein